MHRSLLFRSKSLLFSPLLRFFLNYFLYIFGFEILASKVYEYHQRESGGGEDARESDSDIMRARSSSLAPRFLHARARFCASSRGRRRALFREISAVILDEDD
jgi:hypothetical protein